MPISPHVNRTVSLVPVAFVLLCLLVSGCLVGGYGFLALYPRATPTMSLVDTVRATLTAEALEMTAQPIATSTSPPTLQATAMGTPYLTPQPAATNIHEPTIRPAATATSVPPAPEPAATYTRVPTATNSSVPIPTSTPEAPPSPPPSTTLTRGPYLQSVTPDSIIIAWETSVEVDSVVEYGRTAAYGSTASDYTWTTRHAVTLTGLSPYSGYHYQVGTSAQVLSHDITFKTAAGPGHTSFSFVVLGDTHAGLDAEEFPRRRRLVDTAHRSAVGRITAINPGFYLHLGDLVQEGGDTAGWNHFFAIEGPAMNRITMFPTLGNHERDHQNYFNLFYLPNNERWYSFDYGNAHFICLEVDGYADISPGSEQYRWFENDLAGTDKTWKFVFFHFPAYSSGGGYGSDPMVQAYLVPLFQQYGVDIVFNGHEHNYQRNFVDGVAYLQSSGGGGMIRAPGSFGWTAYLEGTWHVVKISIAGNTLNGIAIRPDGSEFDPFTLTAD